VNKKKQKNFVSILHGRSHNSPTPNSEALVDIFRFEHGKIVEHWDLVQADPRCFAQ
jgi:predicted SnoaL-like aldol condensation-catalyzing enzyme